MDFCPRCGRYLKDDEYQCPECGNIIREIRSEEIPAEVRKAYGMDSENVSLSKALLEKWFFIALAIAFTASFTVTYFWRFSFLFFCFPLFLPMGRMSIAAGALLGICLGSICGFLVKYVDWSFTLIF